jgi:hypothetical protein
MVHFPLEFEWIENLNAKGIEILPISGSYDQAEHKSCRGNHSVGGKIGGAAVHKASPLAKDGSVGREDSVSGLNLIDPSLQFRCLS